MQTIASPLRYPGGKAGLSDLISRVLAANGMAGGTYVEPFAGGAGAALKLLFSERVSRIIINDLDPFIAAFWKSMVERPNDIIRLLDETPASLAEWRKQRKIYDRPGRHSRLRRGFAAFFLNRCSRSGILTKSGPIGGFDQSGKWKVDARYNRQALRKRLELIALYRERIQVSEKDAALFLREDVLPISRKERVFVYLDPPYYVKGQRLYLNAYGHEDHRRLARYVRRIRRFKWLISYDDVPEIRKIYSGLRQTPISLRYTAYGRRAGKELLIYREDMEVPEDPTELVVGRGSMRSDLQLK